MNASRLAHAVLVILLLSVPVVVLADTISVLGHWAGGPCWGLDVRWPRTYHGNGCLLEIADVSDPVTPVPLGRVLLPARVDDVVVAGHLAYVADSYFGLQIVDVTDPAAPFLLSSLTVGTRAAAVDFHDDHVYLVDTYEGLRVIDVSDPAIPTVVHHLDPVPFPQDVVVMDDLAYLSTWNGIFLYDVSNPSSPVQLSFIPEGAYYGYEGITVRDGLLYVAARQGGLRIWDVSVSTQPVFLGAVNLNDSAVDVDLHGDRAVVTCYHTGIKVVDVTRPNDLVIIGQLEPAGGTSEVLCRGGLAYTASYSAGVNIVDLSDPTNLEVLGCCPVGGFGVGLEVRDGTAHVAESNGGLRTIDVTDPFAPTPMGLCTVDDTFREIALEEDLAYTAGYRGVRIFDVADPAGPHQVSFFATDAPVFDIDVHDDLVCYVAGDSGLFVLDVADPAVPVPHGRLAIPGGQGVVMDDRYAYYPVTDYFTELGGLYVVDYTVPGTPTVVGRFETWKAVGVALDGERLYFYGRGADNHVGLVILNVSDPTQPTETGFLQLDWPTSAISAAGDHVYTYQMFIDVLLAIDVSDPSTPTVVAEFERPGWDAYCLHATDEYVYANGVWVLRHDGATGVSSEPPPSTVILEPSFPNPFNPATTIAYQLPEAMSVRLGIYDLRGCLVAVLRDGEIPAGRHEALWNGRDSTGRESPSGVYFSRLEAGGRVVRQRMVLVR